MLGWGCVGGEVWGWAPSGRDSGAPREACAAACRRAVGVASSRARSRNPRISPPPSRRVLIGLGAAGVLCGIALNIADHARKYPVLNWPDARVQRAKEADAAGGGGPAGTGAGDALLGDSQ